MDKIYTHITHSILNNPIFNYGEGKIGKYLGSTPYKLNNFIGRKNELATLHEKLFKENNVQILINGEGGIGKTTLAAEYYYEYKNKYNHLAWVFAERSIIDAMLTLSNDLKISFDSKMTNKDRLKKLIDKMKLLDEPSLLVIDNANHLDDLKAYYIAVSSCPNLHLLITSRISKFSEAQTYIINPLDEDNAIKLFITHYPAHTANENELLKHILEAIGYNTLVIELLAKHLNNIHSRLDIQYTLITLLNDLQKRGIFALPHSERIGTTYKNDGVALREEKPETIIAAMYNLAELDTDEKALLSIFAVLPAESIALETLNTLLPGIVNIKRTANSLAQNGWVGFSDENESYKCSPVVQEVTRQQNSDRLLDDCKLLITTITDKLAYDPKTANLTNISYERGFIYSRYGENILFLIKENNHEIIGLADRVGSFNKTTGNLGKALTCFEKQLQLCQEISNAYSDNISYKNLLAISYEKLGETQFDFGNLIIALNLFEHQKCLFEEIYILYPQNILYKKGLAISYEKLGNIHITLKNINKALESYEKETHLLEELYNIYPQEFKYSLSIAYEKIGEALYELGQVNKALIFYKKYFYLSKELYDEHPHDISLKNAHAMSCSKMGEIYSNLGDLDNALIFHENENRLFQEIYSQFPENVLFKNGLATSYSKLGETQSALGNFSKALVYFEKDKKLSKELYDVYPQNISYKNDYIISFLKLGETYSSIDDFDNALSFFEKYYQLKKELYDTSQYNISFKRDIAFSYLKLGDTHSALGNPEKALTFYEQYFNFMKELYEESPQNISFKNELAISYERIGDTHSILNNLEKVLIFYKQNNQLSKEVYMAYPENFSYKNGLAISYAKLGVFYWITLQDIASAHIYFQQAEPLLAELVADFPSNAELQHNWSNVKKSLRALHQS